MLASRDCALILFQIIEKVVRRLRLLSPFSLLVALLVCVDGLSRPDTSRQEAIPTVDNLAVLLPWLEVERGQADGILRTAGAGHIRSVSLDLIYNTGDLKGQRTGIGIRLTSSSLCRSTLDRTVSR